jgi:UDP-N-acetyl-D-glucosamine/UDP-N-acetyl-D-galactosamine dehydrogenase
MKIVVIGLGYVGLPLTLVLSKHYDCTGVDIDTRRVNELTAGIDRTGQVSSEALASNRLQFLPSLDLCSPADVYIVTVPTPVDAQCRPDLSAIEACTRDLARALAPSRRPLIIYESTVYPGVTEDICGVLIEQASGLRRGRDFFLGYSPERINPGDTEHRLDNVVKVVAGENEEMTDKMADIYGRVTTAGVFRAASIRVAEAAKVLENAQRDINIGFINESAQIFSKMGISIWDVLDAAQTKWNFLTFKPGLVGGHCIGVDPYYLSHRAQELGYEPRIILAGRSTNDGMGRWVADQLHSSRNQNPGKVLVLGLTFKESVPDLRNSKVVDVVRRLSELGHDVTVHDPHACPEAARDEYGLHLDQDAFERDYDLVVGAVPHQQYCEMPPERLKRMVRTGGTLADLKRCWRPDIFDHERISYWSL